MKTPSLKAIAGTMKPQPPVFKEQAAAPAKSYRVAETRADTRQLSGHFPREAVTAFRTLAASRDYDVQQLLAEAINMVFERYGVADRIEMTSGRRTRTPT